MVRTITKANRSKQTREDFEDFLAGAICAECAEGLGYEPVILDELGTTLHKRCYHPEDN